MATGTDANANVWRLLGDALDQVDFTTRDLRVHVDRNRGADVAPEEGDAAFDAAYLEALAAQNELRLLAALVRPL